MRITHRMIANNANVNLQHSLNRLQHYSNRLSSGKLFQRASENPVGVGRVMSYTASIARNEQYSSNINQARGWLDNTELAMQNGLDVLQRIRELAVYGANETLTAEDRRAISPEVGELIRHLIGVANSEANGLYIFGGHQTLEKPYTEEFVYDVKTNYLGKTHNGFSSLESGIGFGSFQKEIGLAFTIDGTPYYLKTSSALRPNEIYKNIRDAIDDDVNLRELINVEYDNAIITFKRLEPGDFSLRATTEEAEKVMSALTLNNDVKASTVNITNLEGINPNSFLPGEYKILTERTVNSYDVNDGTQFYVYSQSEEKLVTNIEATNIADRNQSVSFVVTAIDGDEISLSYEFVQNDPSGIAPLATGTGLIKVDKTDPNPASITIEDAMGNGVTYNIDLADAAFTNGDRIVVNTNAAVAADADLVRLYRKGDAEALFTFAYVNGALDSDAQNFSFFSLDAETGSLLKSSFDLSWDALFLTENNLDYPAAAFTVGVHDGSRTAVDQRVKIETVGLQNGSYDLNKTTEYLDSDLPAEIKTIQSYFQGNAQTIFTGTKVDDAAFPVGVQSDVSASVLLEVREVDADAGTIKYSYKTHQYELDGNYKEDSGVFTLQYGPGAASPQTVQIGDATLEISNLHDLNKTEADSYRVGDRAVMNITPSIAAGATVDRVNFQGEYRGGTSQAAYYFDLGVLEQDVAMRQFTLETYERTLDRGKVYDSAITVNEDIINILQLPQNKGFSYNNFGFPVPSGDNKERICEISPYQQVTVNLSVQKAFGENGEVFKAIFDVYEALMYNDRETLGSSALGKMDKAVDHFLAQLAEVGARANRVEVMEGTLSSQNLYLREVRSQIEDIDLAEMITEFTMQENAYRAALATATMMLQPSLVDYLR